MSHLRCSVCDDILANPIYVSGENRSLTSLCRIYDGETRVFSCLRCGHLQTSALVNVNDYYDSEYDILVASEEEDQIYEVRDDKIIYRTEHQVQIFLEKLRAERVVNLLDYGCAKSSTVRTLCSKVEGLVPHAFDVSARYIKFWRKFIDSDNWAINNVKEQWKSYFDVVTSFFALEHIPGVKGVIREIAGLLKPGGIFYCVVPNVLSNSADFIVADHCNHFTVTSLKILLGEAGLELLEIDANAHRGAFVIVARRPLRSTVSRPQLLNAEIQRICNEHSNIADFWKNASTKIRAYEASLTGDAPIAVYGAGFYGAFISSNLDHPDRIVCYLDQNRFLHGKEFNMRPILSPCDLPADVRTLLVGLNPAHSKAIISDIPALSSRLLNYFYL